MTDPQNPAGPEGTQPPAANEPPAAPAYGAPADQPAPPAYGSAPTAPPAYDAAPPAAPYGAAPSYAAAPPAYGAPADGPIPGKTMGIVAFVLSFFAQLIALILGIVALVQSRKAGHKNGFALAAIIISSVLLVLGIIALIVIFAIVIPLAVQGTEQVIDACIAAGGGIVEVNGVPIDCTEVLDY